MQASLLAAKNFNAGLAMLRQLEFSLFDFKLHMQFKADVYATLAAVKEQVAVIDTPEYNRFANSFSHIFAGGYAAGYYSYKWAEVLAADAYAAFEESGIFDAANADRFRSEILEIGGSRDFMQAYVAFRGRKPEIDALLKQSGFLADDFHNAGAHGSQSCYPQT